MHSDSSAGISSQARLGLGKLKHVHLRHMFLQGLLRDGRLVTSKVHGLENSSDLGTKYLERGLFEKHRAAVGMRRKEEKKDVFEVSKAPVEGALSRMRAGMMMCLMGVFDVMKGADAGGDGQLQCVDKSTMSARNLASSNAESSPWVLRCLLMAFLFGMVMAVAAGVRLERSLARRRKRVDVAVQTEDEPRLHIEADMLTSESIRYQLRDSNVSRQGLKSTLIARLRSYDPRWSMR